MTSEEYEDILYSYRILCWSARILGTIEVVLLFYLIINEFREELNSNSPSPLLTLIKDKEGKRMRLKEKFNKIPGQFDFITNDKATFIEFGNMMKIQANILLAYHFVLEDYRKYSVRLMAFLKKEYHLEKTL